MIFPMGISFTTAAVGLALVAKNCLAAEVVGSDPCPGVLQVVDSATTCCVGGVLTLSVCAGWPICTGPTTVTQSEISCATILYATDSDYSQLASEASVSMAASGTHYQTEVPAAVTAATGASAGDTGASQTQSQGAASTSGSSTPAPTSASASGNAASGSQDKRRYVVEGAAGLVAAAVAVAL